MSVLLLAAAIAIAVTHIFGLTLRPALLKTTWTPETMTTMLASASAATASNSTEMLLAPPARILQTQHVVLLPEAVLFLLATRGNSFAVADLSCVYLPSNARLPPAAVTVSDELLHVHCGVGEPPESSNVTLYLSSVPLAPPQQHLRWDHIAYDAVIDGGTTVVFGKGLGLRQGRLTHPGRYECVYGSDLSKTKSLQVTPALSAAQEVFRCPTPARQPSSGKELLLISVRFKGYGSTTLPSIARPRRLPDLPPATTKKHRICVCTMLRNQASFLREWILYHSRVGVERWFIYDNNSDDNIEDVLRRLIAGGHRVTRHPWPWIKAQEAGFAHCAIRAREHCRWVAFIDVDEFIRLPGNKNATLPGLLNSYSRQRPRIGELRVPCRSFGPSGRKTAPPEGVTVGYTCRLAAPERHKAIVRPEALHPSLMSVVHHFHLRDGMQSVNVGERKMVINHYKYQAWDVFKDKFYRRVATYVADWRDEENAGSKDRAPGLGTKPEEPDDWQTRFCDVNDTGLKDYVLAAFQDRRTGGLPW